MNGVIIVNKPEGFTSFDAVAVMRRLAGEKKVGHCGTLDPNATGVLPVLLGSATKAQDLITDHGKRYTAGFLLGVTSDTLDIWGKLSQRDKSHINRERLESALSDFCGDIMQTPPMYSAVSVGGQRLYSLARQGIEIEREPRKITVFGIRLSSFDFDNQSGTIEVTCSKGTYIRTLIDDIGRSLGLKGAVMSSLVRTCACGFDISQSFDIDTLKSLAAGGGLDSAVIATAELFADYRQITVTDAQARRFSNGGELDRSRTALKEAQLTDGELFRVFGGNGVFLGLAVFDRSNNELKVKKLFL